jgi:putative transcriptional regulator
MSGKRILEGLKDAVAYMDGSADKTQYNSHVVHAMRTPGLVDIKSIRQKMGLTQAGFAASFGFSLYTLRGWEQGKRKPDPAVRAYMRVIEKAPDAVRAALTE